MILRHSLVLFLFGGLKRENHKWRFDFIFYIQISFNVKCRLGKFFSVVISLTNTFLYNIFLFSFYKKYRNANKPFFYVTILSHRTET